MSKGCVFVWVRNALTKSSKWEVVSTTTFMSHRVAQPVGGQVIVVSNESGGLHLVEDGGSQDNGGRKEAMDKHSTDKGPSFQRRAVGMAF